MLTGLYLDNGLVDSQQLLRLGVVARVVEVQELPPVTKQFACINKMFCYDGMLSHLCLKVM